MSTMVPRFWLAAMPCFWRVTSVARRVWDLWMRARRPFAECRMVEAEVVDADAAATTPPLAVAVDATTPPLAAAVVAIMPPCAEAVAVAVTTPPCAATVDATMPLLAEAVAVAATTHPCAATVAVTTPPCAATADATTPPCAATVDATTGVDAIKWAVMARRTRSTSPSTTKAP